MRLPVASLTAPLRLWLGAALGAAVLGGAYLLGSHGRTWAATGLVGAVLAAGAARFLAAHTPTRRELPQVVRIATRLRRGEVLFEEE